MSPTFPRATREDHQTFCLTEGWDELRIARGRTGHHVTYELRLPDGRILRTRISHPPGRQVYGRSLWAHILRDQLDVTAAEFWACVQDRTPPARGEPRPTVDPIPTPIVTQLLAHGVPEADISRMSRAEAIQRMNDIWSQPM